MLRTKNCKCILRIWGEIRGVHQKAVYIEFWGEMGAKRGSKPAGTPAASSLPGWISKIRQP